MKQIEILNAKTRNELESLDFRISGIWITLDGGDKEFV